MKQCPFCAEEIQDAAIVCKHCHRDLPTAVAPVSESPKQQKNNRMIVAVIVGALVLFGYVAVRQPTPAPTRHSASTSEATGSRRNPTGAELAGIIAYGQDVRLDRRWRVCSIVNSQVAGI